MYLDFHESFLGKWGEGRLVAVYKRYKSEQFIYFSFTKFFSSHSNIAVLLQLLHFTQTSVFQRYPYPVCNYLLRFPGFRIDRTNWRYFFLFLQVLRCPEAARRGQSQGQRWQRGTCRSPKGQLRGEQIDCEIKEILNYNWNNPKLENFCRRGLNITRKRHQSQLNCSTA